MKLLLHTCCAPCSVYCIKTLRAENIEPTLYWYNPNIHPYAEYKARRNCLVEYAKQKKVELILEDAYGLDEFCKNVANKIQTRCQDYCYPKRFRQVFQYAKEHGFDYFTTTLSISPYKNSEKLNSIGKKLEDKYDVLYLLSDFKKKNGYKRSIELSREYNLYRQNYCGCIYSQKASLNLEKN